MRKFKLNNSSGFIHMILVSLLPILIGVFIFLFSFISLLNLDRKLKYTCIKEQLQTLTLISSNLDKLFALNKSVVLIRKKKRIATFNYRAAIASAQPELIVAARIQLQIIKARELEIDLKQKLLISSSNLNIQKSDINLNTRFNEIFMSYQKSFISLLNYSHFKFKTMNSQFKRNIPLLRDSPDLAPLYRTPINFEQQMSWVTSWQYQVQTASSIKQFLNESTEFAQECNCGLVNWNSKWEARVKKVKYF